MVSISTGKDSKQDYATPWKLIYEVEDKIGPLCFDLAASEHNAKHANYWTLENQTATQLDIHQFVKARDKHLIPTTTKVTILREPAYNDPIPAEEKIDNVLPPKESE